VFLWYVAAKAKLDDVVYRRARHVITENQRCIDAGTALKSADYVAFGQLMTASHNSLRLLLVNLISQFAAWHHFWKLKSLFFCTSKWLGQFFWILQCSTWINSQNSQNSLFWCKNMPVFSAHTNYCWFWKLSFFGDFGTYIDGTNFLTKNCFYSVNYSSPAHTSSIMNLKHWSQISLCGLYWPHTYRSCDISCALTKIEFGLPSLSQNVETWYSKYSRNYKTISVKIDNRWDHEIGNWIQYYDVFTNLITRMAANMIIVVILAYLINIMTRCKWIWYFKLVCEHSDSDLTKHRKYCFWPLATGCPICV